MWGANVTLYNVLTATFFFAMRYLINEILFFALCFETCIFIHLLWILHWYTFLLYYCSIIDAFSAWICLLIYVLLLISKAPQEVTCYYVNLKDQIKSLIMQALNWMRSSSLVLSMHKLLQSEIVLSRNECPFMCIVVAI